MRNLLELGKQVKVWYYHSVSDNGMITFRNTKNRPEASTVGFFDTMSNQQVDLYTPNGGDTIYASGVMRWKTGKKTVNKLTGKEEDERITWNKKQILALAFKQGGEKAVIIDKPAMHADGVTPLFVPKGEMVTNTEIIKDDNGKVISKTEVPSDTFQWLRFNI